MVSEAILEHLTLKNFLGGGGGGGMPPDLPSCYVVVVTCPPPPPISSAFRRLCVCFSIANTRRVVVTVCLTMLVPELSNSTLSSHLASLSVTCGIVCTLYKTLTFPSSGMKTENGEKVMQYVVNVTVNTNKLQTEGTWNKPTPVYNKLVVRVQLV